MAIEIEKKYRLTAPEREKILATLSERDAVYKGEDFEENTLYTGGILSLKLCVLRLRRIENRAILTYKERLPSESAIKQQIEHETAIDNPEAMGEILKKLGYRPFLVYEKRRKTWHFGSTEIVLDELPFGNFMEIEGAEEEILSVEKQLGVENFTAENRTYPSLTHELGEKKAGIVEARFK